MKKNLSAFILAIAMFASLIAGCAQPAAGPTPTPAPSAAAAPVETAPAAEKLYTAGEYTGTGTGRNGPVSVKVVFTDTAIESVTVAEHSETAGICDTPIERIPSEIVAYQSLGVDVVATATMTSQAILDAVADAVTQAGGDVDALKAVPVTKVASDAVVEKAADVVIVGGGGAGMAAAVAAAEGGANVILVEKTAALGGNTVRSGGGFNAAYQPVQKSQEMTSTQLEQIEGYVSMEPKDEYMARWQEELGKEIEAYKAAGSTYLFDSIYLHMIQTYVGGDYFGNPVQIELMCSAAPETYDWLEARGFQWTKSSSTFLGALWPRTHVAANYKSGIGYIDVLSQYIQSENLPVEILLEVKATELTTEGGKVTGVKGEGADGAQYTFTAGSGVILATGGFSANVEMRQQYNSFWPNLDESVPTTNSPAITGDGIIMAQAVGANLVDMDKIQLLPLADPETGETSNSVGSGTNLLVNKNGVRYVNEYERRDVLATAALSQPGSVVYLISDQANSRLDENNLNTYGRNADDLLAEGKIFRADTLEDLAAQMGIDPATFVESVEKFNAAAKAGIDEEFGRVTFADNAVIDEGPFYACPLAPAVHHTMGGVEVDKELHVLSADGSVIEGLYAAGEVTGGFHGGNRLGGNAISECLTTGRTAGANAAAKK